MHEKYYLCEQLINDFFLSKQSLFAENKEKLILGALQALTQKEMEKISELSNFEIEASFHTLRRLLASKVGFAAFTNLTGYGDFVNFLCHHRNDDCDFVL